jgi:glutaredoxin 3
MAVVKVFSTPTCPWCYRAKQFFQENKIKFTEYNVAVDEKARDEMVEKSGQMGVPVIMIDKKVIVGFDKKAIEQALGKG